MTNNDPHVAWDEYWFQFLIGKIMTERRECLQEKDNQFQFLIGKIMTNKF